jgi:RimJ/RimL family protein N-acetyltransferase
MIKLREFKQEDKSDLIRILNEAEVSKYLSSKIPVPYTSEDAHWWIHTGSKIGIVKAIEAEGQLIGCIGLNRGEFEYERSAEIGYWITKEFWRKGIATQSIDEIVSYAFETTDIVRVFGSVFSENLASMRVLDKCGFELEAIHKQAIYKNNRFYNNHVYSKLKT